MLILERLLFTTTPTVPKVHCVKSVDYHQSICLSGVQLASTASDKLEDEEEIYCFNGFGAAEILLKLVY